MMLDELNMNWELAMAQLDRGFNLPAGVRQGRIFKPLVIPLEGLSVLTAVGYWQGSIPSN